MHQKKIKLINSQIFVISAKKDWYFIHNNLKLHFCE